MDKTQIKEEKTEICRACMNFSTNMCNIFDNSHQNTKKINEIITYCTGLEMLSNDGLPYHICEKCHQNLIIAYTFKKTCLKTDEALRKSLEMKYEIDISPDCIDYDSFKEFNPIKVEKGSKLKYKGKGGPRRQASKKKDTKITPEKNLGEIPEICEICGLVFPKRSARYQHAKQHMAPKYSCDQCDYQTVYKYDLVKHTRTHGQGTKPYQCEYCPTACYVASNLKSHIQRCHKKIKRFTCTVCNHKFYDKTKLGLHMDSHNDIKRHHCEFCGSNFSRITYLKKHLYKSHGIEPVKMRPGRHKNNLTVEVDTKVFTL